MSRSCSIAEARDNFTAVVQEAERYSVVELTRKGESVAVLLSIDEYRRLRAGRKSFWDAYSGFRDRVDLQRLDVEPETFEGLRDASPGRETGWKD